MVRAGAPSARACCVPLTSSLRPLTQRPPLSTPPGDRSAAPCTRGRCALSCRFLKDGTAL
eukprot:scaffold2329_cov247-Pinguiococcus_pyrenoidosus.AAC.17